MIKSDKISDKNKDFFDHVYQVDRVVPYGKVTSYGAVAKYLGSARGARMVGWAMNACMNRDDVPAHRVVNRLGILSGKMHFSSPDEMEKQLIEENEVINNRYKITKVCIGIREGSWSCRGKCIIA